MTGSNGYVVTVICLKNLDPLREVKDERKLTHRWNVQFVGHVTDKFDGRTLSKTKEETVER